jgi:predicted outer membrane repeat protein
LRQAIDAAATGDTINFSPALNGSTITLSSVDGSLDITNDLTIDGSNNAITISGGHSTEVFCVCPGAHLALKNLTVAEGDVSDIGGAIYNGGTLEVTNSTFSGNSAGDSGGAIYNGGTLTVTNSTFSNNSAVNDGGGIFNGSGETATLRNTIVANSPSGGNCFNDGGTLNDGGYNMDDDGTCVSASTSQTVADAKLGPLQNNSGPTFTHALLPTSPALNAIPPAGGCGVGITKDQRGVTRPQGTGCDIGAFELVVTPPPPPPPPPPTPVARPDLYKINQATLLIVASPGVLKNDTGPSPLSAQLVSRPKHGILKLNASGSFSYQPTASYAGIDSFTYRAKRGTSVSNVAKVTIKINKKKKP